MSRRPDPSTDEHALPPHVVLRRGEPSAAGGDRRPGIDVAGILDGYRRVRPPLGVRVAFVVLVAVLLIGPIAQLLSTAAGRPGFGGQELPAGVPWGVTAYALAGMLLSCLLGVVVALEMRAGRRWARAVCVVLAAVALVLTVVGLARHLAPAWGAGDLAPALDPYLFLQVAQAVLLAAAVVLLLVPGTRAHFR